MSGTIIENLSGRKLIILISILLLCQLVCFLIGGVIAPTPSSPETVLATKCLDFSNSKQFVYSRGPGSCQVFDPEKLQDEQLRSIGDSLVFTFQLPIPRGGLILDYSRWQQNLIGIMMIDIVYQREAEMNSQIPLTLDLQLGYRNKEDALDDWKFYAGSVEERTLECAIDKKIPGHFYNCSILPLFELGSLHHDFYLVNLRLPMDKNKNQQLGPVEDIWLVTINQNGGFTKVWVSLKTVFFPIIICIMVWFWRRVHLLNRSPVLLEYMLLTLGLALSLLNMPLEYLTLLFDMPYMLLVGDIRQGIFYSALLSFWLVFAGEHLTIQENQEKLGIRHYWKHLTAVAIGCISLLAFDLLERGTQLRNPFYSIWVSDIGTNLALTFIILAGICAGVYFLFLSYMIWKVFCNISVKRTALPSMSSARRLHYKGIIYRFKFLMLATLLCAAMTVIGFILGIIIYFFTVFKSFIFNNFFIHLSFSGQVSEGKWKWDDNLELEFTSAFFTGVYGMWNVYTFTLMVLYAPSHKKWPTPQEQDQRYSGCEEIEFSRLVQDPSEISSLTSFARKSALD